MMLLFALSAALAAPLPSERVETAQKVGWTGLGISAAGSALVWTGSLAYYDGFIDAANRAVDGTGDPSAADPVVAMRSGLLVSGGLGVSAIGRPVHSFGSALAAHLIEGASLGLLGIQQHTRRRNRMNGRVVAADDDGFEVAVEHSFGNCPKYIRVREAHALGGAALSAAPEARPALDDEARALIADADTLFIASTHAGQVDVSHRGGAPGFVRIDEEGRLLLPDYAGNFFFNTLGNLLLEPRAGLLFIDFERGDLLQLSATAELIWDGPLVEAHPGALRLLRLSVTGMVRTRGGLPLRWSAGE